MDRFSSHSNLDDSTEDGWEVVTHNAGHQGRAAASAAPLSTVPCMALLGVILSLPLHLLIADCHEKRTSQLPTCIGKRSVVGIAFLTEEGRLPRIRMLLD